MPDPPYPVLRGRHHRLRQHEISKLLLDSGVSGIALFGNASEVFALTAAEKQQIAELVVRVNNGRVPLVFGAGGTGIEPAIDSAQWAYKTARMCL